MSSLKDRLKQLFPTKDPAEAARGTSGEIEAGKPPAKERREGDLIPVIAVALAVVGMCVYFLRPQPMPSLNVDGPPANREDNWGSEQTPPESWQN
jgi:hypothetical protein